jgi:hypothetical protein
MACSVCKIQKPVCIQTRLKVPAYIYLARLHQSVESSGSLRFATENFSLHFNDASLLRSEQRSGPLDEREAID